ncbi:MAG: RNA polymerase sigma factor, partial [Candidatus Rokuibacteriota bacterium]
PERLGDHLDRLYRAAWALTGSREDADDLVQETYARVLARPRLLRSEDDLGYLLGALRNTFRAGKRALARRPLTTPLLEERDFTAERATADPQAALEARTVFRTIASLPPAFRDVIVAVDVAGLSYDHAARVLGIPPGTVMSRLFRGRQRVIRLVDGTPP